MLIVYVDMDDVLCDFSMSYDADRKNNPGISYPQSQYGFFANLNPIDDSLDSMRRLIECDRCDPYILTAPSCKNPFSYTEKRVWVEKNLGMKWVERLIICPNKSLLAGHYLIDDNIKGQGQDKFGGELVHFGSSEFPDWESICKYLYFLGEN